MVANWVEALIEWFAHLCFFSGSFAGYYRVNYEPAHWIKLAHVLYGNFHYLPYTTLAIIVDDALNLARLGLLNYSVAFNVVSFLKHNNEHYQPWKLALSNLEFVYHATEDLPSFRHVEVSEPNWGKKKTSMHSCLLLPSPC